MNTIHRPTLVTWLQTAMIGVIYFICVIFVFKSFTIWNQILHLEKYGINAVFDNTHGLRFLLIWPVLYFSDVLDIPSHELFGLVVAFNIVLTSFLLARTQALLTKNANKHWTSWFCFYFPIFAMLSITMNGRLSFMLVGSTLIMLSSTQWLSLVEKRHHPIRAIYYAVLNSLGLLLLSVSSGTFSAGMVSLVLLSVALFVLAQRGRWLHGILSIVSVLPFATLQSIYINKNLEFYDGSILLMMLHGPGKFLIEAEPPRWFLALLFAGATFIGSHLMLTTMHYFRKRTRLLFPVLLVFSSLLIGIFGYAALLTGLCAGLLLVMHVIYQQAHGKTKVSLNLFYPLQRMVKPIELCACLMLSFMVFAGTWNFFPSNWKLFESVIKDHVPNASETDYFNWLAPDSLYPDAINVPSLNYGYHEDRLHYSLGLCAPQSGQGFSWLSDPTLRWYKMNNWD